MFFNLLLRQQKFGNLSPSFRFRSAYFSLKLGKIYKKYFVPAVVIFSGTMASILYVSEQKLRQSQKMSDDLAVFVRKGLVKINVGYRDPMCMTCYYDFRMEAQHVKVMKLLLQYGVCLDKTLLQHISRPENERFFKELLPHIGKIDNEGKLIRKLFFEVLKHQDAATCHMFRLLLENGLPADDFVDEDYTPLHWAIINDRVEIVSSLLGVGADPNKKTRDGVSPLYLSVLCEDNSVAKMLLEKGARVNEVNSSRRTALHEACDNCRLELVTLLLDHGADLNALDKKGRTPLSGGCQDDANIQEVLMKELALMRSGGQTLCIENVEYLQEDQGLEDIFEDCLRELRRAKNRKFSGSLSLYDVFKLRKDPDALSAAMAADNFVLKYKSGWYQQNFRIYGNDLIYLTEKAIKSADEEILTTDSRDALWL